LCRCHNEQEQRDADGNKRRWIWRKEERREGFFKKKYKFLMKKFNKIICKKTHRKIMERNKSKCVVTVQRKSGLEFFCLIRNLFMETKSPFRRRPALS
jgi:hypothetical protein